MVVIVIAGYSFMRGKSHEAQKQAA
jgi:hypothetical protein